MTARYRFEKSWGAEPFGGGVRFRLWAPALDQVALRIGGADLPMAGLDDGWFEIETDAAKPGDGYAFVLPDGVAVNDPAARAQVADVHGPSLVVDPLAFEWRSDGWRGRPWEEAAIYELHVGTFSPEGTFDGVRRRLDHLAGIGVTAVELMPVAQFGGSRGWGYDGVLFYAPHQVYGGPEGLKRLVEAAHERGLMAILDVVYNHFGPDGNYLHLYAPDFFHPERGTPWGGAIAYEKKPVRDFFVENALYWLEEYRFDGLRFDAVDHVDWQADEPILEEIGEAVRCRITDRHVHLATEDDRNIVRLHGRDADGAARLYTAEWNDDVHHCFHAIATGERDGYYEDYADDPVGRLANALATGYVYQGEASPFRDGEPRGEPSAQLPPAAFVNFLQNHDQVGNRAFSERLTTLAEPAMLRSLTAILLLSPHIPLLFMGEEWSETRPFRFFTDFHGELGDAVREGRRREFCKWPLFADESECAKIPDPNALGTFEDSRLDWSRLEHEDGRRRLALVTELLSARRSAIAPLIARIGGHAGAHERLGPDAFAVRWKLAGGGALILQANLDAEPVAAASPAELELLHAHGNGAEQAFAGGQLAPGAVIAAVLPNDFVPLPE